MNILNVSIAILAVCVVACGTKSGKLHTTVHAGNGLELAVPDSLDLGGMRKIGVEQTATGFRVFPANGGQVRYATEATVDLRGGNAEPGDWPASSSIDGRTIHYRIDHAEGGSGGAQFELQAWETCASGHLVYHQSDQSEALAKPRFDLVWNVIEGTTPPD
jgi:hypothetical protein